MRILVAHSRHGSSAPSGENVVFDDEVALLRARGHDVRIFERDVDELHARGIVGQALGAVRLPWNPVVASQLRRAAVEWKPDVVHVHNIFPMLSGAVFSALRGLTARVWTQHNFRIFCSGGLATRLGKVCVDCMTARSVLPAIRHACYRQSHLATVPVALGVAINRWRQTWQRDVEAFITLSDFAKQVLVRDGIEGSRIHVKPNFFRGHPRSLPWTEREHSVVFVGRVGQEKGVATLVKAWDAWGPTAPRLHIVGDGKLRSELIRTAPSSVHFHGLLPASQARDIISRCKLLVLPSEVWEGFPIVLCEAFAFGTASAVSDLGPLPSIVLGDEPAGVIFKPQSEHELLEAVRNLWFDQERLIRLGAAARAKFERFYSEEANYRRLMQIYAAAIELQKSMPPRRFTDDAKTGGR